MMVTNILSYLEASAAQSPEKTAFSGPDERLTFFALQQRAMIAGSRLCDMLPPRRAAAVIMDKSCDAIVAFMSIVYAGGFYCFIDRAQPPARIQTILNKLNPAVIITGASARKRMQEVNAACPVLPLAEVEQGEADPRRLAAVRAGQIDTDPLYCNFTSGSTGTPKGVLVCHRSVIDFIEIFADTFGIGQDDVIGNQAPLDFDVSVKDVYTGLKAGAEVVLIPRSYFTFQKRLLQLLQDRKVTTLIWAVSALCLISMMEGLDMLRPTTIRRVLFSGEVMPVEHLRYWRSQYPQAMFVNLYGPTEITCNCTYYRIPADEPADEPLPIGKPFHNERVFLLDETDRLITQPGVSGELCVAGTAVTLGYYHDPERTRQSFVQNPLHTAYPEIIYRTGDIARYGSNELLYFVGRKDFQIKHHGRRVEPGEIEAALSQCGAKRACVVYMEQEEKIIAFVIAYGEPAAMLKALRTKLPDYMLPSEIIPLAELPLTHNGKIDRGRLKELWRKRKAEQA